MIKSSKQSTGQPPNQEYPSFTLKHASTSCESTDTHTKITHEDKHIKKAKHKNTHFHRLISTTVFPHCCIICPEKNLLLAALCGYVSTGAHEKNDHAISLACPRLLLDDHNSFLCLCLHKCVVWGGGKVVLSGSWGGRGVRLLLSSQTLQSNWTL